MPTFPVSNTNSRIALLNGNPAVSRETRGFPSLLRSRFGF
jgi:hypothetical protein